MRISKRNVAIAKIVAALCVSTYAVLRLTGWSSPLQLQGEGSNGHAIPFVLHQSWKTRELPTLFRQMSGTFRRQNPEWEYRLWTDEENEQLMLDHYSWFNSTWRAFPRHIYRVDAVRAFYLHMHGGAYFDLDFWCLRPMGPLVSKLKGVVLGYMSDDHDYPHSVPNAFMASEKGQAFWLFYARRIDRLFREARREGRELSEPEALTGPAALFETVKEWKQLCTTLRVPHNITIMDRKYWYLNDWHRPGVDGNEWFKVEAEPDRYCAPKYFDLHRCAKGFPNTYTVTLWTHSWEEVDWGYRQDVDKSNLSAQGQEVDEPQAADHGLGEGHSAQPDAVDLARGGGGGQTGQLQEVPQGQAEHDTQGQENRWPQVVAQDQGQGQGQGHAVDRGQEVEQLHGATPGQGSHVAEVAAQDRDGGQTHAVPQGDGAVGTGQGSSNVSAMPGSSSSSGGDDGDDGGAGDGGNDHGSRSHAAAAAADDDGEGIVVRGSAGGVDGGRGGNSSEPGTIEGSGDGSLGGDGSSSVTWSNRRDYKDKRRGLDRQRRPSRQVGHWGF